MQDKTLQEKNTLYSPKFPDEWDEKSLYSLANWLNGMAFKDFAFVSKGKPIIKIAEIKNGISSQTRFTNDEYDSKYLLKKGEMLFCWSGQPQTSIDTFWWNGPSGWLNQHIYKVSPKIENKYFFYYLLKYLKPNFIQIAINKQTTGLGHVTKADLERFVVKLPNPEEQRAIAIVLYSLDDKIELLRRQNKTLESTAQAIFKEWFVNFHFPGSTRKMIDSELGNIPEGWRIVSLEDVTEKITDGSHYSPESHENGYPMASVKDMTEWDIDINNCRKISLTDYNELVRCDCRPLKNDILIAKDGSFLKHIFMVPEDLDVVVLSSIAIIRTNGVYAPILLANLLKSEVILKQLENIVSGAVIRRIVLKDFRKFKIIIPADSIQLKAQNILNPIYKKCLNNNSQIQTLSILRDKLLPKLMRGELCVKGFSN